MSLSEEHIDRVRNYFQSRPIIKAYLFGSFARNQEQPESDLDILVQIDYSQPVGLEFIQMKFDLENILHRKVDLVSEKAVSKYIRPFIDKEKLLIYARAGK
jgi:hypothetical protein